MLGLIPTTRNLGSAEGTRALCMQDFPECLTQDAEVRRWTIRTRGGGRNWVRLAPRQVDPRGGLVCGSSVPLTMRRMSWTNGPPQSGLAGRASDMPMRAESSRHGGLIGWGTHIAHIGLNVDGRPLA